MHDGKFEGREVDELRYCLWEKVDEDRRTVGRGLVRGKYPVEVRGLACDYAVSAQQYDPVPYYLSVDDATKDIRCNWDDVEEV